MTCNDSSTVGSTAPNRPTNTDLLDRTQVIDPRFANTCWSLIATNDGVKVGAAYKAGAEKIEVTSKFISKTGEAADLRKQTYEESVGWYDGISKDIFG